MTTTTNDRRVELTEFTIRHDEPENSIVYRENPDEGDQIIGDDDGRLRVRLGIDGMWTIVSTEPGRTSPLTLIERSITALTEIRDQLALTDRRAGRCLVNGDWGRCGDRERHEGEHTFPTEAEWRSFNSVPSAVSA